MNRIMIAGTNSGCGKTAVTCAVLSALKSRGTSVTAFKCGPDYIDPMFHRAASGIKSYNLDPFFLKDQELLTHFAAKAGPQNIIESAMGYYDGIGSSEEASAYTLAKKTETPVILVLSAKGAGNSLGAVIEGFLRHKPENFIKGVIFNHAGGHRAGGLEKIAERTGIKSYGCFPENEKIKLPSRNMGLVAAEELSNLPNILSELGKQAEQSLDIDGIIALSRTAAVFQKECSHGNVRKEHIRYRTAVARDRAFCFLYEENLEILEELGCEPVFFSPMYDEKLPDDIRGLYLCGGYPELYSEILSKNKTMAESIRTAILGGMPAIAEGGGFLYLHKTLERLGELNGRPMCGVIGAAAFETKEKVRFGYITVTAKRDSLLCRAGESIRSREFHYCDSDCPGDDFIARKANGNTSYSCVHATDTLYAGFPHLYFPANTEFARNFVRKIKNYGS